MVNYICLRYSINQNVKSHLRITKYIFGLKLRESIIMKTIDPLNLNARFFLLSLGAKYDTRLPPWDMALLPVCFEFRFMQIVVNNSSSMKLLNVLNNFRTEIIHFFRFERFKTERSHVKGAGIFFFRKFVSFGFNQMSGITFN